MKKLITLLSLLLVLTLSLFAFTACSNGGDDGDDNNTNITDDENNGDNTDDENNGDNTDDNNDDQQPHVHVYVPTVVDPTCISGGYTEHKCSCGDSYIDTETAKLAHVLDENGNCTNCTAKASEGLRISKISGKNEYAVKGLGDYAGKEVIIPAIYKDYPVTEISASAFKEKGIESVYIPASVSIIKKQAFQKCEALKNVVFYGSDSVLETIEYRAFYSCNALELNEVNGAGYISVNGKNKFLLNGLVDATQVIVDNDCFAILDGAFSNHATITEITLPSSVKFIGESAFYKCNTLNKVSYIGSASEWNDVTLVDAYSNPSYYATDAYFNNELLSVLELNVQKVNNYAFINNSAISKIIIADGVTEIGEQAFYGCGKVYTVSLGTGLTSIGDKAFSNCYKLVEVKNDSAVEIEPGVTSTTNGDIGTFVKNVYSQTLGSSVLEVLPNGYTLMTIDGKKCVVEYAGTEKDVVIPLGVVEILPYAFSHNQNIETVDFGSTLKTIGTFAFYGCKSLKSITIPANIKTINDSAFLACSNVETLTFAENGVSKLEYIGKYAFSGLVLIESVYLPDGLKLADDYCFQNCSNITSFSMPGTLTRLAYRMINGCMQLKIADFRGTGFMELTMQDDPVTGAIFFFWWYYESGLEWVNTYGGAWEVEPHGR